METSMSTILELAGLLYTVSLGKKDLGCFRRMAIKGLGGKPEKFWNRCIVPKKNWLWATARKQDVVAYGGCLFSLDKSTKCRQEVD